MSFDIPRVHKWEENIEREVTDELYSYVCEYYGVDEIADLTEEQMNEVEEYRDNDLNEYSPLQIGFSNIIQNWESETWERENS
jgi:hypothetical protein